MTLERLALSRSTLDRAAHRRNEPELVTRLLADARTAVLVLDGDRAPVRDGPDGARLALVDPGTARELLLAVGQSPVPGPDVAPSGQDAGPRGLRETGTGTGARVGVTAFLGQDASGRAYVLLAAPRVSHAASGAVPSPAGGTTPQGRPGGFAEVTADWPVPPGAQWRDLRAVGDELDDTDAGVLTCAVGLANWHSAHGRCPRCGGGTQPIQAGWAQACPACGDEHYPRTDPAVIMAVVDVDGRILLGRQGRWADGRFSTLAGFVEPGESAEAAVRREVAEEAGVAVGAVEFLGSQPWPFPSSLMLGFRASALTTEITVDGVELAQARWWTRQELALDLSAGRLRLPPRVSIARRLIEDWYGGLLAADDGIRAEGRSAP